VNTVIGAWNSSELYRGADKFLARPTSPMYFVWWCEYFVWC